MPAIVQKNSEEVLTEWEDVKRGEFFVWGGDLYLEVEGGPVRIRDFDTDVRHEIEDDSKVKIVIPKITY